jgi:hypothetical protein
MAEDQKISQAPEALTLAPNDLIPIVQTSSGLNKYIKGENLIPSSGFTTDDIYYNAGWSDLSTLVMLPNVVYKVQNTTSGSDRLMVSFDASAVDGDQFMITDGSVNGNINSLVWITGQSNVSPRIVMSSNETLIFTKSDGTVWLTSRTSKGVISGENTGDNATNTTSNTYADGKVVNTLNNSDTTHAPSSDVVYDALALKSDIASPTFTGTTTTPDIIVSSATALTIAHFDATKNIESLPLDTYPSLTELSYVKGLTGAVQFQIDGKLAAYILTNYVKVDLQNGVNATAIVGRQDKPYLTLQAAYDAVIAIGGTNAYYFDIVGDATITSNVLTFSSTRGNFTFVFTGNITLSIVNSGATKGMFSQGTYGISNNNYVFNGNFTQTTNVGLGIGLYASTSNYNNIIFNRNVTLKNPKGSQDNYGVYLAGNYNTFYAKKLTWDITNDTAVTPYIDVFQMGTYPNIYIETLQVIGTSTVAYNPTLTYGANISSFVIVNQVWTCALTTITGISLTETTTTIDYCRLDNVSIASNANLKNITFNLIRANSINTLIIGNASLLAGFFDIYCTTIKSFNIGNYLTTGIISGDELPFIEGVITFNSITRTLSTTRPILTLRGGTKLIGGIITVNNTLNSTYAPIKLYYTSSISTRYVEMVNVTIKNTGIPATSSEGSPFFRGASSISNPAYLLLQGCTFIGTLGNTNTGTTVFKTEGDTTSLPLNVEGNYVTNYMGTVGTGVTINAEYTLITNLQP